MSVQDLVSIVVPVHNGEQFLRENVECILNQTYTDLEIIYVCDGCTDKTVEILQEYILVDSRIKVYVESEKQGVAVSRNIGKGIAKGDWIIFLDCDDLFETHMIETMVCFGIKTGADMCCCFWEEFMDSPVSNKRINNTTLERYSATYPVIDVSKEEKYILQLVHHCPWNKLIHKSIYQNRAVFFQDIPNCNDAYFSFVSALEAARIVYVDEILVHYRSSIDRNTISEGRKKIKNYVWEAYDKLYCYIVHKNRNKYLKQSFYNRVCSDIFKLIDSHVYKSLYSNLREIYFTKWGMHNSNIQEKLSYLNQEIYKKLCVGDSAMDRLMIIKQAKEHFVHDTAKKGGCSIWGCGYRFRELLGNLNLAEIGVEHLYDSDSNKCGIDIAGKTVEQFNGEWSECIIVTSPQYYEEIKKQIGDRAGLVYNLEEEIFMY